MAHTSRELLLSWNTPYKTGVAEGFPLQSKNLKPESPLANSENVEKPARPELGNRFAVDHATLKTPLADMLALCSAPPLRPSPIFAPKASLGLGSALSRCRTIDANDLVNDRAHAAAVAARHVSMAEARKARCVLAEMRWR